MALRSSNLGSPAALLRLRDAERLRRYRFYQDFYDGKHFAAGRAGGRTRLVLNYARTVVDKGVAYLLGRGLNFSVPPKRERSRASRARARRAETIVYDVYADNGLDAVDLQVAQNAGVLGDGVYKVFWDPVERQIRVVNVDPFSFFATWCPDDPERLVRAETAYTLGGEECVERWTAETFELLRGETVEVVGPNPYGQIPFVHVPNLQPPNQFWGRSDLVDVIAINRELDERVSDQADIIRYHADPPVVFKGVTEHSELAVGPGTVWDIPADAAVHLLEWQGQPPAVDAHIERVFRALYEVSETPRTAFGDSGRVLSGVALEMELRPIVQKTLRRRAFWSRALRRRNELILRLAEQYGVVPSSELRGPSAGPSSELVSYGPYRTTVVWPPMVPSDDAQDIRNQVALVEAGLRSRRTAMDQLGTESPEEEIERILEDRATPEARGQGSKAGEDVSPDPRERGEP